MRFMVVTKSEVKERSSSWEIVTLYIKFDDVNIRYKAAQGIAMTITIDPDT